MPVSELLVSDLKELRHLLSNKKRWTRYSWARTADRAGVEPDHPYATAWCLLGGCRRVTQEDYSHIGFARYRRIEDALFRTLEDENIGLADPRDREGSIARWQDSVDHAEVLAFIDDTIAREERR